MWIHQSSQSVFPTTQQSNATQIYESPVDFLWREEAVDSVHASFPFEFVRTTSWRLLPAVEWAVVGDKDVWMFSQHIVYAKKLTAELYVIVLCTVMEGHPPPS